MLQSLVFICSLFLHTLAVSGHGSHHSGDDDLSSSAEHQDLRATSLIAVKIWCMIIIFASTFFVGMSPYFMKWNEAFLVLGTQFASGIFLGTALMHFLSDATVTFGSLTKKEYPFAFMLACAGYLLAMLADCGVLYIYGKEKVESSGAHLELQGVLRHARSINNGGTSESRDQVYNGPTVDFSRSPLAKATALGDSTALIIGLCFHSVFEGITIGVKGTKADAWRGMWTVALHKLFAAIAMGVSLFRIIPGRPLLSSTACAFAFAVSSPFGVVIGIVIDAEKQGRPADWIYGISMGLACGVFIYVAINHLLSWGYTPQKTVVVERPHYKYFAVLLGVGVIATVMIWDA